MNEDDIQDLLCPACGAGMVSKDFCGQVVEKCFSCGGMWFDNEELRKAQEQLDSAIVWSEKALDYAENLEVKSERDINCPRDDAKLVSLRYGPSDVVVDICPKCKGTWFDYGEFNKVTEDIKEASLGKTSIEYLKDVAHEITEVVTGDKTVKEEIGDVRKTWHLFKNRLAIDHPFFENFIEGIGKTFS